MKLTLAVLTVSLLVVAGMLRSQSARIQDLERAIHQLNSKMEERAHDKNTNLEAQEKCSEQARRFFADLGYEKKQTAGYENHYNPLMNKCFIQVGNTEIQQSTIWTYRNVFDAFEGKEYGSYSWHTVKDKKYWEVPPFECKVTLPSGEQKPCGSKEEFTDLVRIYMEDAH